MLREDRSTKRSVVRYSNGTSSGWCRLGSATTERLASALPIGNYDGCVDGWSCNFRTASQNRPAQGATRIIAPEQTTWRKPAGRSGDTRVRQSGRMTHGGTLSQRAARAFELFQRPPGRERILAASRAASFGKLPRQQNECGVPARRSVLVSLGYARSSAGERESAAGPQ
jgi:hypothetical protein